MRMIDADAALKVINGVFNIASDTTPIPVGVIKALISNMLTIETITPTVGGWVSVKNGLPEEREKCLIMDKCDVTIGTLIDKGNEIWQWQDSDFYGRGGITHWMPLPELPEEENHETD